MSKGDNIDKRVEEFLLKNSRPLPPASRGELLKIVDRLELRSHLPFFKISMATLSLAIVLSLFYISQVGVQSPQLSNAELDTFFNEIFYEEEVSIGDEWLALID